MKIKPITDLRKTNEISEECHKEDEPIFITKNGYSDLVIMSQNSYDQLNKKSHIILPNNKERKLLINTEVSHPLGLVKVGCATIDVSVADPKTNAIEIIKKVKEAESNKCSLLVLPELCLTGYTCSDLFFQKKLLLEVEKGISKIQKETSNSDVLFLFGAPLVMDNKLYNTAIVMLRGEILGVVAKKYIPNYNEFYEKRQFEKCPENNTTIVINNVSYPFGNKFIFVNSKYPDMKVGIEICEDLWAPNTPSTALALNGATIICNLSASNELVGKREYRRNLVSMTSAREVVGYLYASAGNGESTTDMVFSGHNLIYENGKLLKEATLFKNETIYSEIDLDRINADRIKNTTFANDFDSSYEYIYFYLDLKSLQITREIKQNPFIPQEKEINFELVNLIIKMQAMGLVKRMKVTSCKHAVIGLSGGLDSTLALIVILEAYKELSIPYSEIVAITLPAFGTTSRTLNNVKELCQLLSIPLREINIGNTLVSHLKDIGHQEGLYNNAYENAQARERTQVLMDVANDCNGMVIGTGDLSELALGWCTYNGDQMSMYGVNSSIPKTLVKYLVQGYALQHENIKKVLFDILDTPISPELLPAKEGQIDQKTEDIIGPYELHDFFLYYFIRYNLTTKKILLLANHAYKDKYDEETIKKWLKVFIKRFFTSQFKRSAMPDGVKVGTVSLSPRGDLRMPSDANYLSFIEDLD